MHYYTQKSAKDKSPNIRSRKARLELTQLTDEQFDVGNLLRHIYHSLNLLRRHEDNLKAGVQLSLNQMRQRWHTHMNTLKRALSYTRDQLVMAFRLVNEKKYPEAIDVLCSTGLPEMPIMARLRVVQAGTTSVANCNRSMELERGKSKHRSVLGTSNDRESINGGVTPYGFTPVGQTARDITSGQPEISAPLPFCSLPTGSTTDLGPNGCGINRSAIYSSPKQGAPARTPERALVPPSPTVEGCAEEGEKSIHLQPWQVKRLFNRFKDPSALKRCLKGIDHNFWFAKWGHLLISGIIRNGKRKEKNASKNKKEILQQG